MKKILTAFLLLTALVACKTYSDEDKKNFDLQINQYLKNEQLKCQKTASGLYYKIIQPGKGEYIKFQDIVSFSYRGSFLDGKLFDKQVKPIEFPVKELIPAWKELLLEMKPGAELIMVVPPHLGYGNNELDDIPPHSILVFEMKIHGVK